MIRAIRDDQANADIAPYHDRQMAVLTRDRRLAWLEGLVPEEDILRPLPAGSFHVRCRSGADTGRRSSGTGLISGLVRQLRGSFTVASGQARDAPSAFQSKTPIKRFLDVMIWFAAPNNNSESSRAGTADNAEKVANAGKPPRILIVEDEFLIALELENRLLDAGYEVVGIAATAGEAVSIAGSGSPDLAIMDIRLAGRGDGVDAAIELYNTFGIRSIFSSAHADAETRKRAIPASPIGWLQKPFTAPALIELIRSYLD